MRTSRSRHAHSELLSSRQLIFLWVQHETFKIEPNAVRCRTVCNSDRQKHPGLCVACKLCTAIIHTGACNKLTLHGMVAEGTGTHRLAVETEAGGALGRVRSDGGRSAVHGAPLHLQAGPLLLVPPRPLAPPRPQLQSTMTSQHRPLAEPALSQSKCTSRHRHHKRDVWWAVLISKTTSSWVCAHGNLAVAHTACMPGWQGVLTLAEPLSEPLSESAGVAT